MSTMRSTLSAIILHAAIFGTLGLLALDTFGFPEKTNKYLGIGSETFVIPVLLIILGANLLLHIHLHGRVQSLFRVGAGVLLPLLGVITWYWVRMLENSIYAQFRLHPDGLMLLFLTMASAILLTEPRTWWKQHWQKVLIILPFLGWIVIYLMSLWPMNFLKEIVKEDHIVEWLQFWVLFIGGILSLMKAWAEFKSKKRNWLYFLFFLGTGLAFIFVAGDEIAWGQRALGLEVSEEVLAANRQGEYTVHNLYAVEWAVAYLYAILSGFGIAGRWLFTQAAKLSAQLKFLVPFTPHYALLPIFAFAFLFFAQQLRIMWGIWHVWSEPAELLLYLGLVLWVLLTEHPRSGKSQSNP